MRGRAGVLCGSAVQVAGEHRSLELKNGRFTDDFAGHTRHIYRIK